MTAKDKALEIIGANLDVLEEEPGDLRFEDREKIRDMIRRLDVLCVSSAWADEHRAGSELSGGSYRAELDRLFESTRDESAPSKRPANDLDIGKIGIRSPGTW